MRRLGYTNYVAQGGDWGNAVTEQMALQAPPELIGIQGVSAYPDEIYTAPLSWTERAYPGLIHYQRLPKGGHFAAWEQPESFVAEPRASFRSLR
jgi:hypothetical protein